MVTLFERHLLSLSSFLILVSAPVSAFSATTVLDPGKSLVVTRVYESNGVSLIDREEAVIDHAVPGSGSVAASGSEVSPPNPPNTFSTVSGTVTAGVYDYVFSLKWTGAGHMTRTGQSDSPFAAAYSHLCAVAFFEGPCDQLTFQVSAPTPITLAASGTAANGQAHSGFVLFCDSTNPTTIIQDEAELSNGPGSENFDHRFSTTVSPGVYVFRYSGYVTLGESASLDASASLNIVLTLSPVGDCSDGLDNDGDTLVDLDDSDCVDGTDTSEAASPPGVPALSTAGRVALLTALLLLTLPHLRARPRA